MSGSQPNGPNTYPGQTPSSGPIQQPYQAPRIDPDMVPNVVRIFFSLRIQNRILKYTNLSRFKFLNKVKKKLNNHL
jgi:hypothetical protein